MNGDQPVGTMDYRLQPISNHHFCDGYQGHGVWEIRYDFPNGKYNGAHYKGTRRNAYLPDTQEGREVLTLLLKAFERKLLFTVGTSVTTGATNVVVWNGIHHKTNLFGGSSHFGYPDPTYFNRVKLECADRGIVLESLEEIK
jgi:deltex-like protein